MAKSADQLKKSLRNAFAERGEKAAFLRKTKFAPSQVESWLSGTAPTLDTLDRIADALEAEPWQLILPEGEATIPKSKHTAELARLENELILSREDLKASRRQYNQLIDRTGPEPEDMPGVSSLLLKGIRALVTMNDDELGLFVPMLLVKPGQSAELEFKKKAQK